MSFRRFVLVTHRWLGLGSSVVLAIVAGTGSLILWTLPDWLRRIVGPMHQSLGFEKIGFESEGRWIVIATSAVAAVLALGGLILWWKLKIIRVKTAAGWRRALFDVHHVLGFVGFLLMFTLAVSGIGMIVTVPDSGEFQRIIVNLHTTRGFPFWLKVIWAMGSAAFVVQGVSGVVMWWKPRTSTSNRRSRELEVSEIQLTSSAPRTSRNGS